MECVAVPMGAVGVLAAPMGALTVGITPQQGQHPFGDKAKEQELLEQQKRVRMGAPMGAEMGMEQPLV